MKLAIKKATTFEWREKCEKAFYELRHCLTITPILTLSVEGKDYSIHSNASRNGLSYVLMQEHKVVTYAS